MNKGLGKGLGALIAMFDEENETSIAVMESADGVRSVVETTNNKQTTGGVTEINIALIDNNPDQPRKEFDPTALQELSDSIKSNGVFQPIIVKQVGSRYMIVAGERRWRASKMAGLLHIPAIVRNYTDRQVAEIAIVENLQRQDLNEIELAIGVRKLMNDFHLTQEKVSIVLGKSRSSIANTLRLLALPPEIQTMVIDNKLSVGHAKCLVAIEDNNKAIDLAKKCVALGLSVRNLENMIRNIENPQPKENLDTNSKLSPELKRIARKMSQSLGTKVSIKGDDHKGKLTLDYYSQEELEKIIEILSGDLHSN